MTQEGPADLLAYQVRPYDPLPIVRAPATRPWMDRTDQRFAYRCLPLTIANQFGWHVLNTHRIRCYWKGGPEPGSLVITSEAGPLSAPCPAVSHFGSGIVTFNLNYVFRTPPGYSLWCRGPSNVAIEGICPLEGVVETDWSPATFTMNWKMTTPHLPVYFEIGDPICAVLPVRRRDLERFQPRLRMLASDPELEMAHSQWSQDRAVFNAALAAGADWAVERGWQRDYILGKTSGVVPVDHQVRVQLNDVIDETHSH